MDVMSSAGVSSRTIRNEKIKCTIVSSLGIPNFHRLAASTAVFCSSGLPLTTFALVTLPALSTVTATCTSPEVFAVRAIGG